MAELNLTERAKIINSVFDDIHITPRLLSRIYKLHNIKKKQLKVIKCNSKKYTPEVVESMTTATWTFVQRLIKNGYEII